MGPQGDARGSSAQYHPVVTSETGRTDPRVKRVSERVWVYGHDWTRLEPTIGMVLTAEGWVAVDGGNTPSHGRRAYEAMQAIEAAPVRYVINTHRHFDHVFGNQAFEAPVVGSQRCFERFSQNVQDDWSSGRALGWLEAHIFPLNRGLSAADFADLTLVTPSISFAERLALHFGRLSLELFPLSGVHSDDGVGVYVPQERVLFLGDAFYFQGTSEGRALRLPELLDRVDKLDVKVYVPGHERPHDRATFERLRRYVHELVAFVSAESAGGTTLDAVLKRHRFDPSLNKTSFLSAKQHRRLVRAAWRELAPKVPRA